jgi:nitrogen fixation/metabolism regulation signal transduction histidine kinase
MNDDRLLLARFPQPIAVLDQQLDVTFANAACERLFGTPPGERGAMTRALAAIGTLQSPLARAASWVRQPGRTTSFQWADQLSGRTYLVRISGLDAGGEMTVVFDDVSALAEIRGIEAEARRYLERVLNHLDRGVVVLDEAFRVTFFNAYHAELRAAVGDESPPLDMIGAVVADVYPVLDGVEWEAVRQRVVEAGDTVVRERVPFPREAPARTLRITVQPLATVPPDGRGAVCVTEDVTRLVELEDDLRRAERVVLLGQMALSLNHEINNPLTTILGIAETLLHGTVLAPQVAVRLEMLRASALRIADVTRRLRELRALEMGRYRSAASDAGSRPASPGQAEPA